jgi:NAD(P)-dependent dehydrogenase (short-subunit alcohol dehydrogenase family)
MASTDRARRAHDTLFPNGLHGDCDGSLVDVFDNSLRMIEGSVARRAGTPDEVDAVGALLMGPDGGFITGSDFLMDGGVTAAYWYGDVAEVRRP